MGILINTGFDLGSSSPIDNRTVKNTTNERNALVTDGLVYENLKVYCKDTQTEYRWTGTEWEEVGTGSSGGDLDLTDYQKKTDNTLDTTDKTITGSINEVNGNLLDTVGFSADYKNIILNRKSGLNPYTIPISAIINNASLAELKDIDSTDIGNGKTLIYDAATGKHKYVGSTGTDELVKMDSTGDAHYLADLIDKQTVVNDNGVLKVKKLDGQEVTITEINYLKGLTMNVMDLVSAFANGGVKVINTPLNTASELSTIDRSAFIDGISYIVYVLADENHAGAKTTYLVDKDNTTFFGNADSQRNFTTNPLNLANEVTGKLGTSNIDVDNLWTLLTINDTYKTLTTSNEIFGTHGAKAMYDELTTEIGAKANATDLTTHTSDTDTHVTTTDKAKWDKVDKKVDKTSITTTIDISSTDEQVPSAKATYVLANTKADASHTHTISDIKGLSIPRVYDWTFKKQTYATMEAFLIDMVNRGIIINNASNSVVISFPYFYAAVPEITELNEKGFVKNSLAGGCLYIDGVYSTDTSNQGNRIVVRFEGEENSFVYLDNSGWGTERHTYRQYATNWATRVEDVDTTTITPINRAITGTIEYTVKNGICYVSFFDVESTITGNFLSISTTMPKPAINSSSAIVKHVGSGNIGFVYIDKNTTKLTANIYVTDIIGGCSFSYPVAE